MFPSFLLTVETSSACPCALLCAICAYFKPPLMPSCFQDENLPPSRPGGKLGSYVFLYTPPQHDELPFSPFFFLYRGHAVLLIRDRTRGTPALQPFLGERCSLRCFSFSTHFQTRVFPRRCVPGDFNLQLFFLLQAFSKVWILGALSHAKPFLVSTPAVFLHPPFFYFVPPQVLVFWLCEKDLTLFGLCSWGIVRVVSFFLFPQRGLVLNHPSLSFGRSLLLA